MPKKEKVRFDMREEPLEPHRDHQLDARPFQEHAIPEEATKSRTAGAGQGPHLSRRRTQIMQSAEGPVACPTSQLPPDVGGCLPCRVSRVHGPPRNPGRGEDGGGLNRVARPKRLLRTIGPPTSAAWSLGGDRVWVRKPDAGSRDPANGSPAEESAELEA